MIFERLMHLNFPHFFVSANSALKHSPSKKKLTARTRATSVTDSAAPANYDQLAISQESGNLHRPSKQAYNHLAESAYIPNMAVVLYCPREFAVDFTLSQVLSLQP